MRNIRELLREKEAELQHLEKEIEALRLAASLLNQEGSSAATETAATETNVAFASPQSPAATLSLEERTSGITVSGAPALRQFP
jgi:hypothetical protein